jgi:hypothetical protein
LTTTGTRGGGTFEGAAEALDFDPLAGARPVADPPLAPDALADGSLLPLIGGVEVDALGRPLGGGTGGRVRGGGPFGTSRGGSRGVPPFAPVAVGSSRSSSASSSVVITAASFGRGRSETCARDGGRWLGLPGGSPTAGA